MVLFHLFSFSFISFAVAFILGFPPIPATSSRQPHHGHPRNTEIRHHQIVSTAHSVIVTPSPTRHTYTTAASTALEHPLQRSSDSRLPPDLLPYGQHHHQQSILHTPGTLKTSSSSSTGSSSSTVIFDHRNGTCNGGSSAGSNSRITVEEPDLRIYHNDAFMNAGGGGGGGAGKSYGSKKAMAMSPSPTTSSHRSFNAHKMPTTTSPVPLGAHTKQPVPITASASATTTLPHRTKLVYELTPSAQILNNASYNTLHSHRHLPSATNGSGTMGGVQCKARQSVVRTSPSFSFLSAGYNQQQGNFL